MPKVNYTPEYFAAQREKFDASCIKLEERARANPAAFRWRVRALCLLGFGFPLVALAFWIGAWAAMIYVLFFDSPSQNWILKEAFPYAAFAFLYLLLVKLYLSIHGHHCNNIFVKPGYLFGAIPMKVLPALVRIIRETFPRAHYLTREAAPQLYAELDEAGSKERPLREVMVGLTYKMDAETVPYGSIPLSSNDYFLLVLGLPLLSVVPPSEFRCILAHEYKLLSADHPHLMNGTSKIQAFWNLLIEKDAGQDDWVFSAFHLWFSPHLKACTLAMSRQNIYAADARSAELFGANNSARALMRVSVMHEVCLEKFWAPFCERAKTEAEPPRDTIQSLHTFLRAPVDTATTQKWVNATLLYQPNYQSLEPTLAQRLRALGQDPDMTIPAGPNAAEFYLGQYLITLMDEMSQGFAKASQPQWDKMRADWKAEAERLTTLEEKAKSVSLDCKQEWKLAVATHSTRGRERGLEAYLAYAEKYPDFGEAHSRAGVLLLEKGDELGLQFLERAYQLLSRTMVNAFGPAYKFLLQRERIEEAAVWAARALAFHDKERCAELERKHIEPSDMFFPHGLEEAELGRLHLVLSQQPEIYRLVLVQKRLTHFPEDPLLVAGLLVRGKFLSIELGDERRERIYKWAAETINFPVACSFQMLNAPRTRSLLEPMEAVSGSVVYQDSIGEVPRPSLP